MYCSAKKKPLLTGLAVIWLPSLTVLSCLSSFSTDNAPPALNTKSYSLDFLKKQRLLTLRNLQWCPMSVCYQQMHPVIFLLLYILSDCEIHDYSAESLEVSSKVNNHCCSSRIFSLKVAFCDTVIDGGFSVGLSKI